MKSFYVSTLFVFFAITGCEAKRESNIQDTRSAIQIQEFKEIVESNDGNKQKKLFEQMQKSAENKDASAQNLLGVVYENGFLGQNEDIERAINWYKKSANNGSGIAENNIGNLYYRGQGLEKNDELAYKFYKKSMEKNTPEAINSIGLMYFNGSFVTADKKQACDYFKKSADLGYYLGESNVANCYLNGWNGSIDKNKYF